MEQLAHFLLPLLLSLVAGLVAWGAYGHRRFVSRNEREHERMAEEARDAACRMTRVETRVDYVEEELRHARRQD